MLEDPTHLTVSIDSPTDDTGWAALEALGVALAKSLPVRAIVTVLHVWQVRLVDRVCGPSGEPVRGLAAPLACTRCGAEEDFARKGRRNRLRRLDTIIGTVGFRLWQVRCRGCDRVFAPLLAMLGLVCKRRSDRLTVDLAGPPATCPMAAPPRRIGGSPPPGRPRAGPRGGGRHCRDARRTSARDHPSAGGVPRWHHADVGVLDELVEAFISISTRQGIQRGSFNSQGDLIDAIESFIDGWNERCQPFVWTKPADVVRAKAERKQTIPTED